MTRNDEVPQDVGEALERVEELFAGGFDGGDARKLAAELMGHFMTLTNQRAALRAKLEAAEGEVARLREDARRAQTALMAIQQRTQCTSYGMGADVAQIADAALQEHTP